MTRGRRRTRAVDGSYWTTSMTSSRCTTAPGVIPRFSPTVNGLRSTWVGLVGDAFDALAGAPPGAGGDPGFPPRGEGAGVAGGRHPAVAHQVVQHVTEPADDAAPAGVEGALERRRVAEQRVRGRQGAQARIEDEACLLHLVPVGAAGLGLVD